MARFNLVRSTGLAVLLLGVGVAASAQGTVKCESNNGGRNYCGMFPPSQVTMRRQISGSPCVRGNSWGVDSRGLWVDRGCRAEFVISRGGGPPPPPAPGGPGGGFPPGGGGGWSHQRPGDPWPPSGNWNGGNWGRGGACFYRDRDFGGDYFCLRRGENRPMLGGDMNRAISSIRIFGGARTTIFSDPNFNGHRATASNDVNDLKQWRLPGMSSSWNDRISSLRVQ